MTHDTEKIAALVSFNLSLTSFQQWAQQWEPVFRALAPLGQVAVAIVTVIYIIKKIRSKKARRKNTRK